MIKSGGQVIVDYLKKEKVPYILGIPGHGIFGLFDAIRQAHGAGEISYIQVKHEQAAAHLADGYYRIKGEPLAIFTSIGPGTLNTAIGLATAYVDSSAFLQFSGDVHVHMRGTGVLQEIERYQDSNIAGSLEPLVKRIWRAESSAQLPRLMRRAFNQMLGGRPGPVVLALPMDVQAASVEDAVLPEGPYRTHAKPAGDPACIERAVRLMKTAKRPVIVAGGGMLRSRAYKALVKLAETWGAAVITTMAGKSAFPENHPLYVFHTGSKGTLPGLQTSREADVILGLGVRFADETTCSYRKGAAFSFPETKLIQVDIDPAEIGKNYPCETGIVADVGLALDQILDAYGPTGDFDYRNSPYTEKIASLKKTWFEKIAKERKTRFDRITISQLIGELSTCLPEETIITTSSGNTQAQLFQEYTFTVPGTHLTTGGFSTMGWAFPAAMGAKLAKPETPVVALLGDGDFMMVMQELSTMAQYQIPVLVILANNSGWMAIKDLQNDVLGSDYVFGNDWMRNGAVYSPDFTKIGEAFGVHAQRISQCGEVGPAVKAALNSGKPALIEVDVHRECSRPGSSAFGWWDVPIPAYMPEQQAIYEARKREEQI
ncbi:MAG: thiamine pyrophosphate-binding protein [Treponema sp.]|jgi:acetolactate synthase-1/2/3 large subunit|nr:thiamine pyrophosphate-binding protein [Treponema sp.]